MILLVTTVLIQQVILKPYVTKVLYYEILEVVESRAKLVAKAKAMLALLVNAAEVCFPALTFVRNWLAWWGFGGSKCGETKETKQVEEDSDISTADPQFLSQNEDDSDHSSLLEDEEKQKQ